MPRTVLMIAVDFKGHTHNEKTPDGSTEKVVTGMYFWCLSGSLRISVYPQTVYCATPLQQQQQQQQQQNKKII